MKEEHMRKIIKIAVSATLFIIGLSILGGIAFDEPVPGSEEYYAAAEDAGDLFSGVGVLVSIIVGFALCFVGIYGLRDYLKRLN